MKWPIVGESGAYNGGHQRVQIASENIVIILIYVSLLSMITTKFTLRMDFKHFEHGCPFSNKATFCQRTKKKC